MKAGFYGGVVIDFPNSAKAKKFFLVLMTGGAAPLPQALGILIILFSYYETQRLWNNYITIHLFHIFTQELMTVKIHYK